MVLVNGVEKKPLNDLSECPQATAKNENVSNGG